MCVPLRTVAAELFLPFHHVGLAPIFFDQLVDVVATFAGALWLAERAIDDNRQAALEAKIE
jgi:hypothetical protein